ncbi:sigma-70 family RNA polymerase sigma factor [Corynebacterium belfantii]|uniref:RNA polymerase sigma factor n=1 Tax=Corynebacterium belfantii TaxID=2014537 RepID=UPI0018D3BDD8|nr:ECF-type sigma factor [Corynebacterium belfantii]MBG9318310.1 sigma-70 family RNA polymerase sigma factor [Corynebacterium belfantii]
MEITIRDNDNLIALDVPEGEFTEMIQRDQEERAAEAGHPVGPRSPQEIIDELNRKDYNGWHRHNRQDRQTSNISLEAYNEHGNQADIATFGAYRPWELMELSRAINRMVKDLPPRQLQAYQQIVEENLSVTEVAPIMGISKAAVSTLLGKIRVKVAQEISEQGLNK